MDRLEVQIELDASKVQQGASTINQAMEGTTQPVEKVLDAVGNLNDALKTIPEGAQKAGQGMKRVQESSKGVGEAAGEAAKKIQVSQKQYDTMVQKLQQYEKALKASVAVENSLRKEYQQTMAALEKQNASYEKRERISADYESRLQDVIDSEIKHGTAAESLAEALDGVEVKQQAIADSTKKMVESQKRAIDSGEGMSRMLTTMSFSAAATTARLAGADGLANALQATGASISAFLLAGANPVSQVMAGITAGLNLIGVAYQTVKASAEKAKQQMDELKSSASASFSVREELASMTRYFEKLEKVNAATLEGKNAKERLAALFPQLVIGWDSEGNAILGNNESLRTQIDLLRERAQISNLEVLDQGKTAMPKAIEDRAKQTDKLAKAEAELIRTRQELENSEPLFVDDYDTYKLGLEQQIRDLEDAIDKYRISSKTAAADVSEGMRGILDATLSGMENLTEAQMTAARSYMLDNLEELSSMFEQTLGESGWNSALQEFRTTIESVANDTDAVSAAQEQLAASSETAAQSFSKLQTSASGTSDDLRKILTEMEKLANIRGAILTVENFGKANSTSEKDTKKNADAISFLAKQYGISEKAVSENLDMLKNDLALKQAITNAEYAQAAASAFATKAQVNAMALAGTVTREEANVIIEALDDVIRKFVEWKATAGAGGDIGFDFGLINGSSGGGGGGSSQRKAAWQSEIEMMEKVKSEMDDLGAVYIATLERMLEDQRLSATERQRIEKELAYATSGELEQTYIDYLENILARQKLNADQRLEVEQKLIQAQKELQQQTLDQLDALGNAVVDALRNRYAAEQQVQAESLSQQIQARQKAASAEKEAINEARDAEVKRLQDTRDAQVKMIEEIRDARVKAIEDERDEMAESIEAQIKAIDDYIKARDRKDKDETDEDKLNRLRQELAFEKDAYNQVKLQEQIVQTEKDIAKRKEDERLADEKAALKEQLATVKDEAKDEIAAIKDKAKEQLEITKETATAAIEAAKESAAQQLKILQQQLDNEIENLNQRQKENEEYWSKRLSNEALMGEALVLLNDGTQGEILKLLQDYNPEYLKAGNEMGQMLYDGFDAKYRDLLERTEEVTRDISRKAQKAIDDWKRMQTLVGGGSGSIPSYNNLNVVAFGEQMRLAADTIDDAMYGALSRMVEAPRNYYATRAAEAGLESYAVADFSNGNLNAVTAAALANKAANNTPTHPTDFFKSTAQNMPPVNQTFNFNTETVTPWQVQSATRRGIEQALRQSTRG